MDTVLQERGGFFKIVGAAHGAHTRALAGALDTGLEGGMDLEKGGEHEQLGLGIEGFDLFEVEDGVFLDLLEAGLFEVLLVEGIIVDAEGDQDAVGPVGKLVERFGAKALAADREVEVIGIERAHQAVDIGFSGLGGEEPLADGIAEDQIAFAGRGDGSGVVPQTKAGEGEAVPVGEIDGDPMVSLG